MRRGNAPQRVDEILIQVSDMRRSLKFYRDGLGIALKATRYGDDSYEANVGGVRFLIHPEFEQSLAKRHRGAGIHIHLWVPDADVYFAQLRQRGISVVEPPADRPWGRHLTVIDPDGYRIEILGPQKGKPSKNRRDSRRPAR